MGNGVIGIMFGLMARIIGGLIWLGKKIGNGLILFIVKGIRGESLNPREFEPEDVRTVVLAVLAVILVIVGFCLL